MDREERKDSPKPRRVKSWDIEEIMARARKIVGLKPIGEEAKRDHYEETGNRESLWELWTSPETRERKTSKSTLI